MDHWISTGGGGGGGIRSYFHNQSFGGLFTACKLCRIFLEEGDN